MSAGKSTRRPGDTIGLTAIIGQANRRYVWSAGLEVIGEWLSCQEVAMAEEICRTWRRSLFVP